jgi:hypothetical protein
MDIPLDQPEVFAGALARGARMLEGTGVPILPMRTTARQLGMSWEQSYGLQLIGCFLTMQGSFRSAVKASGEPWEGLVMPWGSTPLTDPLCSTAVMEIVHDGCEASRTEKVDWLVRHTKVSGDLRVCWEGPTLDRNCGKCEKCVRTMLNFWCLGHPVPAAFPAPPSPEQVATIPVRNRIQLAELESILRLAEGRHGEDDPILLALRRRVAQEQARLRRAEIGRAMKTAVKARLGPDLSRRLGGMRARLRG